MKRNRINPVDVINEQFKALHERFTAAADPNERRILHKRLKNLENVMRFVTSNSLHKAA